MSRFDVIVCGSLHLDIVVNAPRLPELDETAVGSAWRFVCGGKGRNQAAHAASAGARVAMIGRVGHDAFGEQLLASLDAAWVDRSEVTADTAAGSGMSVAIVDAAGDYGAVIVSGANLASDPEEMGAALRRLGPAAVLALQNEVPEAVNLAAARAARAAGARVILNAAPARPLGAALLACVDVLVVNRGEAAALAGMAVDSAAAAAVTAVQLAGGTRAAVVTLGGDGLALAAADGASQTVAAEAVTVVSSHGAGDCFVGALAARLAAGAELADACRAAASAAARHVAGRPAA